MKKAIIFYFCTLLSIYSCEPPVDCTDPKCADSPLLTKLKANLSDTSSILHLGDTLVMRLKIPDTLVTNDGKFSVQNVQLAYLPVGFHSVDTIISQSVFTINSEPFLLKKGRLASQSSIIEIDVVDREAEVHFILKKKGKFRIQISPQSQRMLITTKEGKQFLLMSNVGFNVVDQHHDLYLTWIGDLNSRSEQSVYFKNLNEKGIGFYAFKVE